MKSTGIIRRLDDLGRVVLPIELRRSFGWREHDRVEIFTEDDRIILQKYEPNCCFCGNSRDLKEFHGRQVCARCIEKLAEK